MNYDESAKFYSYSDEDQDLWTLLTRTRDAVARLREKELQKYYLSPEQAKILFLVQALGQKATPAAISRLILCQPHTVSALLDRMQQKGLVQKIKDLDRKNLVRVVITEKGVKAYNYSSRCASIHQIMSTLTPKERKVLKASLQKLLDSGRKEISLDQEEPIIEY